ncbi:MAG: hypothetical protein RML57_01635 [Acidobacteriota bacterium]|nr:hypothetical protein [Acidobacteriota bacterium]
MGRATICAGSRWCVGRNPLYAAVLGVLLSAVAFGQTARDFVLDGRDAWRSAKQNARLSGRLGGERMVGRRVARCVSVGSPVWSFSRDRSYRIAPTVVNVGAFGGRRVVNVTVEAGCAWTAVSNVPWVTIASGASGSRSGIDGDVVAFNRGGMWEGMAASAGRTFKVVQPGVGGGARPENLDSTFGAGQVGTGYVIHAVAVQPDGKVVIGGQFNLVNGVARNCIARLNADGTLDMGFGAGTANDDFPFVLAVAVQPDGKVVIGGGFTRVNGVARGGIARLNVDGTLDASFGARQSGASDWVEAMAVQPDGKVVIGGRFTRVNGVARGGIARLNADGTLDTSFGAGQGGVSGGNFPRVHAVAVQPDGKVVIGGKFTRVNGVARELYCAVERGWDTGRKLWRWAERGEWFG